MNQSGNLFFFDKITNGPGLCRLPALRLIFYRFSFCIRLISRIIVDRRIKLYLRDHCQVTIRNCKARYTSKHIFVAR